MRYLAIVSVSISLFSEVLFATPKADSITAFTGARTKIVWQRKVWCNTDYTPKTKTSVTATPGSVMLFDTDEGTERVLGTCNLEDATARISRSGRWAFIFDSTKTTIYDLTGTNPNPRTFLAKGSSAFWAARAWAMDSATGIEYVYALNGYNISSHHGNALYKIPINADGTANVAGAVKLTIAGNPQIENAVSVSADMKKIGGLFPWPDNPAILDVATGALATHIVGEACHSNLAADNSYRFFHVGDGHTDITMWDKGMSTTSWNMSLDKNMINGMQSEYMFERWTNNPRFIATTFPEYGEDWYNNRVWSWSAATVKTKGLNVVKSCLLQRLAPDFKTIEKSLSIVADIRNIECLPDVWMANGYTGGKPVKTNLSLGQNRQLSINITTQGKCISLHNIPANTKITVLNAQGKTITRHSLQNFASVNINDLDPGVYLVKLDENSRSVSNQVIITQ